ncbi:MAG TPA: hypothetical protein VK657_09360 [Terriglobales bacterium]|nr:hypothetical protein [Terriglobales bacterium]
MRLRWSLAWALLASLAAATSLRPISVEQLAQRSQLIVEARALTSYARWNPQHTLIFTYTEFRPLRALKGTLATPLIVKQLGGSAGGYTQHVAGVRRWQPGDEAVLFLRPSAAADGSMIVVGLSQGDFRIERFAGSPARASNGVPEISSSRPGSTGQFFTGSSTTLSDLENRVRRALKK